jgi:hypothetical protein
LTESLDKIYINEQQMGLFGGNQRRLFNEKIPDSGRRIDSANAGDEALRGREISDVRGNVVLRYRPEYGTLPEVSSKPIGTWKSS